MVKKDWQHHTHRRAAIVFDQIHAALEAVKRSGEMTEDEFFSNPDNPYLALLDELYSEDFQLGRLMDTSDLIIHAEGPSVTELATDTRAASWLMKTADRQFRRLVISTMNLSDHERRRIAKHVNLQLTGFAPGSLYAGFRLEAPEDDLFPGGEDAAWKIARSVLRKLSVIPEFITDEELLPEIHDVITDPAILDVSIETAFNLSPTGNYGIHTIELSAPGEHKASELGQRERVVLREALKHPKMREKRSGTFVGEVREIDLDAKRFHIRGIEGVGAIRCVYPGLTGSKARMMLERIVRVSGDYETDRNGKPRLLMVREFELVQIPEQDSLID